MVAKRILKYSVNGLFWSITIFILVPIFGLTLISVYKNFLTSSIAFTLDTLYLNWNTTFPAVTVCEIYNGEKNWDISENYFGADRDHQIDDFVSEITFFSGTCESCYRCNNITCPTNFSNLIKTYRTSCENIITNCSWFNVNFDCCLEFEPLLTEYGTCYSFNSIQSKKSVDDFRYINNRESGPGILKFIAHDDVQIHVHPTHDIPFLFSEGVIRETVLFGSRKEIIFNVMEIYNDPSVFNYDPDIRKCRFLDELSPFNKSNPIYKLYSFSTCIVECVRFMQMLLCNCHFVIQFENSTLCDIEGIKCLSENHQQIISSRRNCDCMSSCEEPEYGIVYTSPEETNHESEASKIIVSMIELPTQRYVRKVVKNFLDLIISIGGIAGLFFGASVLSIIEIFYNIFVTMRKVLPQVKRYKIKTKGRSKLNKNPIPYKN